MPRGNSFNCTICPEWIFRRSVNRIYRYTLTDWRNGFQIINGLEKAIKIKLRETHTCLGLYNGEYHAAKLEYKLDVHFCLFTYLADISLNLSPWSNRLPFTFSFFFWYLNGLLLHSSFICCGILIPLQVHTRKTHQIRHILVDCLLSNLTGIHILPLMTAFMGGSFGDQTEQVPVQNCYQTFVPANFLLIHSKWH